MVGLLFVLLWAVVKRNAWFLHKSVLLFSYSLLVEIDVYNYLSRLL